jgi:hypothetical protein
MSKISVLDFWKKYSGSKIHFKKHPELPLNLNLNLFFNNYFGRLCSHRFEVHDKDHLKLICKNCIHINQPSLEHICDSHVGIIKGQVEKITSEKYSMKRIWNNNTCNIAFDAKEE